MMTEILALGGFLLACFAAAATGAVFKPGPWYERLNHPPWRPPNWLFPIAWSVLFLLIALSAWLVWRVDGLGWPIAVWGISLAINAGWSALFFGLRRMDWALVELIALWLSIVATIVVFAPIDATAAWLLAPYLVWVSFAGCLNASLIRRNPRERGAIAV